MKFVYYSASWCGLSILPRRPGSTWRRWISATVRRGFPTLDIMAGGETLKRIVRWFGQKALMREVEELL